MSKDIFSDWHTKELIRLHHKNRSTLHDVFAEIQLQEAAKMRALLKPFKYEELLGGVTKSIALENHINSLANLIETVNRKDFFGTSALDNFKGRMDETVQSIIRPLRESVAFSDLIKNTQIDTAKMFGTAVSDFLPSQKSLISSIASLQSDWPGSSIAVPSIEGMTGLMSLRNAVDVRPFGGSATNAFQSLLGKWDSAKLTESVFSDWKARTELYLNQGFDARLTAFPERAFDGALFGSGLLRPELFSPVYPPPSDYESEETEEKDLDEDGIVKRRMIDAYDLLFNLETQIREYLTEVMTERFGHVWVKQRVPGDIYTKWKETRDAAVQKGEKEQPIIAYADFTHYEVIIARKDNWKDVFKEIFCSLPDIQVSLQRLYPIRNCTAHSRLVTKEDFLLLTVEVSRILKAINKLDDGR